MKILYLVHADPKEEFSGTPIITQQYIDLAIKKGFEVCLLTPNSKKLNNFNQLVKKYQKFTHYYWPLSKDNNQLSFYKENYTDNLKNISIPFVPDIIHIIDLVNFETSILKELKKFNVPIIRHVWNFEDLCYFVQPIYRFPDKSFCKAPLNIDTCSKCVATNIFKNQKKTIYQKLKYLFIDYEKKNYILAKSEISNRNKLFKFQFNSIINHLIFPSESFAKYFLSHEKLNTPISIINHGIKLPKKEINKKSVDDRSIKILYTGGIRKEKGWDIIQSVFKRLFDEGVKNIKLRIYGDRQQAAKSILKKYESVEFFENYNPDQLSSVFSWADLAIAPTYFETFCRVVREYITYEVVPITTPAFGITEIIKDKYNGILLNKPYGQDLYKTLKNLISDPQNIKNLKKGIKKTIIDSDEEEYTKLILLYKSIISSKNNINQKNDN